MSEPINCNPCCSTDTTTQIVGAQGDKGDAGTNGTNGVNAFTFTTDDFVIPAEGDPVTVLVANSSWMAVDQVLIISDGTNFGHFQVVSFPSTSAVVVNFLNYGGDTATGNTISSGAIVSPSGLNFSLSAALPTAFTDNTGGTQSDTLAAGVGVSSLSFHCNLADLAAADFVTTFTLGYKFKILSFDFVVDKPATTAAKAATITPKISGVALTGGVINLTSANCTPQGVVVNGSAITGNNTGSNSATISLTGSAVTAFVEGSGSFVLRIQNMDTADAAASLAKHVNDIITSLS